MEHHLSRQDLLQEEGIFNSISVVSQGIVKEVSDLYGMKLFFSLEMFFKG